MAAKLLNRQKIALKMAFSKLKRIIKKKASKPQLIATLTEFAEIYDIVDDEGRIVAPKNYDTLDTDHLRKLAKGIVTDFSEWLKEEEKKENENKS